MINKEFFQKFIGEDFVIKEIIKDVDGIYAFYVSREYEESKGRDIFNLIGLGPLYYDLKTKECVKLSSTEFYRDHQHKEIFSKQFLRDSDDYRLMIERIKARKYINGDEYEIFMNQNNISFGDVLISSDFENEYISSKNKYVIKKFQDFLKLCNLSFRMEGENKIIVDISEEINT
ncbi:MAG: hypothetical protein WBA74_06655 [Cyclobacteriaceae bacterium]